MTFFAPNCRFEVIERGYSLKVIRCASFLHTKPTRPARNYIFFHNYAITSMRWRCSKLHIHKIENTADKPRDIQAQFQHRSLFRKHSSLVRSSASFVSFRFQKNERLCWCDVSHCSLKHKFQTRSSSTVDGFLNTVNGIVSIG